MNVRKCVSLNEETVAAFDELNKQFKSRWGTEFELSPIVDSLLIGGMKDAVNMRCVWRRSKLLREMFYIKKWSRDSNL